MNNALLDSVIDFKEIGIDFKDKPIIIGGLAMEFYGIRKHGDDIDFIITDRDYQTLRKKYPNHKKDIWGDFGILYNGYEMFRSIWKFDYCYYQENCIEFDLYKIISMDMLFRMKVFAMNSGEKHFRDVELIKEYFKRKQNSGYKMYMDANIDRYLSVKDGIILNGDYM
jgi:hypothetical protein